MTKFCVFWKMLPYPTTACGIILVFVFGIDGRLAYLNWAGFQTDWRTEKVEIVTKCDGKI